MHNLPMVCLNDRISWMIDSAIGRVQICDVDNEGKAWGQSLRVYIELEIEKPLAQGRSINVVGLKSWSSFTYEKMPKICLRCGRISHGD